MTTKGFMQKEQLQVGYEVVAMLLEEDGRRKSGEL